MNRIYQGKVTAVEIPSGKNEWESLENDIWQKALREQHKTFQDGVNYYFVALAAMAEGLKPAKEDDRLKEIESLEEELRIRKSAKGKKAKRSDEEKKKDERDEARLAQLRQQEAVWQWRKRVEEGWENVARGAEVFEGPKKRLSCLLGLPAGKDSFEDACKAVLKISKATPEQRTSALIRLLELIGASGNDAKLASLTESKLPWICNPTTSGLTDDATRSKRRRVAQIAVKRMTGKTGEEFTKLAKHFRPALFVQSRKLVQGEAAKQGLLAAFALAVKFQNDTKNAKHFDASARLASIEDKFKKHLESLPPQITVNLAAGKHQKEYRFAALLRAWPEQPAIVRSFLIITKKLADDKDLEVVAFDPLKDARTDDDKPVFDYFTNIAFIAPAATEKNIAEDPKAAQEEEGEDEEANENRARWFEFDKAAFVEALKAPHRYFQDTLERDKERAKVKARLDKMDGEGEEADSDDDTSERTPGFYGDKRIDKIKELIRDRELLSYLDDDDDAQDAEYGINENTLRGWSKLRDAWREAAEKPEFADPLALETELNRIRVEQQGNRQEETGSGGLFKFLQRQTYRCIWLDKPKENQADDALWAWVRYRELKEEIKSLGEAIRFTPAHATDSPRFFIFPKTSRANGKSPKNSERPGLKSDHVPKTFAEDDSGKIVAITGKEEWLKGRPRLMAFNAGVLFPTKDGLQPTPARIYYAAPRLRRDAIRGEGSAGLGNAAMIQPMMEALGIAPEVPSVNFANCAVTLMAEQEDDDDEGNQAEEKSWRINLAFPVSLENEKLLAHPLFNHAKRWSLQKYKSGTAHAQFNFSGGDDLREISLRWPKDRENSDRATDPKTGWWYEDGKGFTCLPVDLGQRVGGAFALLDVRSSSDFGKNKQGKPIPSRFVGATPGKQWHAAVIATGMLTLAGEDADVLRLRTQATTDRPSPDDRNKKDTNPGKDFREELWGDRGRPALRLGDPRALRDETEEARDLLTKFDQLDIMPAGWDQPKTTLTFPEQNDYLLKAVRRFISRVRRLHRWCAFLQLNEKNDKRAGERKKRALEEIREACGLDDNGKPKISEQTKQELAGETWITVSIRALVKDEKCDVVLASQLEGLLTPMLDALPRQIEVITNRCVPLRGRQWKWELLKQDEHGKPLHILRQKKPARSNARMTMSDGKERDVTWIRGQRGLSSVRIEQIEILRKTLQSLNQIQRRKIGELPKRQRRGQDGGIPRLPDCCPKLLDKIAELKKQRVNQLAHQILAEALGLRLAQRTTNQLAKILGVTFANPEKPTLKEIQRVNWEAEQRDIHGIYEKILDKNGKWRGVVDFIILEDLEYYNTTVMRSRRENTRLMRWCRRHFRNKLKQLCEVFGIPVVETNPADTSKFCSRSGVAGFRAVEVGSGFERGFVWNKALEQLKRHNRKEIKLEPDELARGRAIEKLVEQVKDAEKIPTKNGRPRTLIAPNGSGNIFVPVAALDKTYHPAEKGDPIFRFSKPKTENLNSALIPAIVQADIGAATNLGFRAIAEPTLWEVHQRLRTGRPKPEKPGEAAPLELYTREKRKYGKNVEKLSLTLSDESAIHKSRQPHYYWDFAEITNWDSATVASPADSKQKISLISGKALWGEVKKLCWKRCREINDARLAAWKNKADDLPK